MVVKKKIPRPGILFAANFHDINSNLRENGVMHVGGLISLRILSAFNQTETYEYCVHETLQSITVSHATACSVSVLTLTH
jgi:hypothetical protein